VIEPLEGTRPDGQIVVDMMNRMGYRQEGYSAEILLKEISGIVAFFRGVKWDDLGKNGKQWPVSEDGTETKILHTVIQTRQGKFHTWDFNISPELNGNGGQFRIS
jgi:formate dehydrogenase major subunit